MRELNHELPKRLKVTQSSHYCVRALRNRVFYDGPAKSRLAKKNKENRVTNFAHKWNHHGRFWQKPSKRRNTAGRSQNH